MNRIAQLQAFLEVEPQDPFLHYSLALEYEKTDEAQAWAQYTHLLGMHPDYLPTYYHAAKLLVLFGRIEEARQLYGRGIALSRQQGDRKATQELERALQALEEDE